MFIGLLSAIEAEYTTNQMKKICWVVILIQFAVSESSFYFFLIYKKI